ncbi:MAG: DNA gyrase subunit A [Anaerolineae bacterium]|nr:DNA gyrase subunit A [Anaerolineae bacterium]
MEQPQDIFGNIQTVDIDEEMRSAYLDYAMSTIVARALPDARDGMKPVHRRILYAMHDLGNRSNVPHKKSARIVGEVMGKYHPHGDAAIYDSMARLSQDWSMRYPFVDGQGNFGSIDGDSPAASRYTEARMSRMAEEMLVDIDKNTVEWADNFDSSLLEPVVLPARMPNLLMNGSQGIAVGMATNIPPHNLIELVNALVFMIDHYERSEDISAEELMAFIKGPDFPTGGTILGVEGIRQAYSTGRGRLLVRGKAEIEEMRGDRHRIIISEIPYQLNKTNLIERIAELVRGEKITAISDLRDESDRTGMRIVIELKRGAQPNQVRNQLYKFTPLQSTFGVQMLALVDGVPRTLSLRRCLKIFIEHRREVIVRRTQFDLDKARARAHILEGLLKALAHLDDVIETIRRSPDADTARTRLMERFDLSELQAQAILDMQLRRLAALERMKIEDEHKEIMARIAYLEDLLANPQKVLAIIKEDLLELGEKYGDDRRTEIDANADMELNEEDLVADEPMLVSISERGYIKRLRPSTYRTQGRGRVGVIGQTMREEDEIIILFSARTLHTVLFFTDQGKVYSERVYRIPEAGRTDRGISVLNILAMDARERITAAVVVPDFNSGGYCFLATSNARCKRIPLQEFEDVRPSGLIAVNLDEDCALGWAVLTSGKDDVVFVTREGQALRVPEKEIRVMGRTAAGVRSIDLADGDELVGVDAAEKNGSLLVVTENGYGKRTELTQYPQRHRGGKGVHTINVHSMGEIGKIVSARVVQEQDQITIISTDGIVLRTRVDEIREMGRATRGVKVMNLSRGGTVAAVARLTSEGEDSPASPEPEGNGSEG